MLYKKRVQYESFFSSGETTNDTHEYDTVDSNDVDDENLDCSESGLILVSQDLIQEVPDLTNEQNINEVIKKVRNIVVYFKRSPTKNDTVLQKYVKLENGKKLSLLLDCKTRWNSLLTMLERFILLKPSFQKALIDLNHSIRLEDFDFVLIAEIIDVLAPVKLTVEALCRRDSNLCTADAALKFLLNNLTEKKSLLNNKMLTSLLHRIKQRRRVELSDLLNYLQNPRQGKEESEYTDNFSIPNQTTIKKQIKILIKRLNHTKDEDNEEEETEGTPIQQQPFHQLTLKEKLQEIEKSLRIIEPETKKRTDLLTSIKKELSLFDNGGTRGHHLELVYKYLLSIPPISVEAERAFSAAGYIGNKLRSRLEDDTLDALLYFFVYIFKNLFKINSNFFVTL